MATQYQHGDREHRASCRRRTPPRGCARPAADAARDHDGLAPGSLPRRSCTHGSFSAAKAAPTRRAAVLGALLALSVIAQPTAIETKAWEEQLLAARALANKAEYGRAQALLRALAAQLQGRTDPAGAQFAAATWNDLGTVYIDLGKMREAERCLRTSIRLWEKAAGPSAPGLANPLDSLGQVLALRHRFGEAERAYRRSLQIREQTYGRDHPMVANVLNSLAVLLIQMGEPGRAEDVLLRALSNLERGPNADFKEMAAVQLNLGELYRIQKRYSDAETLMRDGLTGLREIFGADHLRYAAGLAAMAMLYADWGQPEHAETLIREALSTAQAKLGPAHVDMAQYHRVYGYVLGAAGRKREAEVQGRPNRSRRPRRARACENTRWT
ncbi:MAG: tetratricopeptide repeat protein [Bryobacteraceae bacterium]